VKQKTIFSPKNNRENKNKIFFNLGSGTLFKNHVAKILGIFIDLGGFAASGGFTAHMYCHKKEKEKKEKSEQGRRSYFTLKRTRNDDVTRRNKRAPSRNKQQGRENKGWERTGRGRGRGGGGK